MAEFHGKSGKVMWDSDGTEAQIDHVTSWSCDITCDTAEVTAMADTWKSRVGGFKDWTATVECHVDSGGLDVPIATGGTEALGENTPAKLELWLDTTGGSIKVLYGSAICTGVSPNQDASDTSKVTYTFEGQDVIAWGTADPSYE